MVETLCVAVKITFKQLNIYCGDSDISCPVDAIQDVTRDVHYENYRAQYITKTMRETNVDRSSAVVTRAAFEQVRNICLFRPNVYLLVGLYVPFASYKMAQVSVFII